MTTKTQVARRATLGPNWQARQSALNLVGCAVYAALTIGYPQMAVPLGCVGSVLFVRGVLNGMAARDQIEFEKLVQATRQPWCTWKDLQKVCGGPELSDQTWIGYGFAWDTSHCQAVTEFLKSDWRELYHQSRNRVMLRRYLRAHCAQTILHPLISARKYAALKNAVAAEPGYRWIHALGKERAMYLSKRDLEGHMIVFGTTGAGKSRFMEHLMVQAVLQGRTVFVIDPKGDVGLEKSLRKACDVNGRSNRFLHLHLAYPDKSIRLNLLANYSRMSEVASRIADTLPGQGGEGQVFVDVCRGYLRTICDGLQILGKKPSFKNLYHYFINRDCLCQEALGCFLRRVYSEKEVDELLKGLKPNQKLPSLIEHYRQGAVKVPEVDGLINLAMLDIGTFQKMSASMEILLSSLARGDIGEMLSPTDNGQEEQSFYDTRKIIERNCVLYVGLRGMSDSGMARVIGSMLLADLAATAGARYDFDDAPSPVSLFVDEAAELTCEPLTQMLNKSRGAKFTICLATQTVADFVAKAKDSAEAMRILANLNNFIALRCNDIDTQDFFCRRIPKTRITTTMRSHGVSTTSDKLTASAGSVSERIQEEEVDLVPAELLGALPNCEFFAVFAGGHVIKGRVPILVESKDQFKR